MRRVSKGLLIKRGVDGLKSDSGAYAHASPILEHQVACMRVRVRVGRCSNLVCAYRYTRCREEPVLLISCFNVLFAVSVRRVKFPFNVENRRNWVTTWHTIGGKSRKWVRLLFYSTFCAFYWRGLRSRVKNKSVKLDTIIRHRSEEMISVIC